MHPIRNLSKGQRRLCVEIVDYSWLGLELPMKQENWELAIIDYPKKKLYWKIQLQTTMAIIVIYKCTLHGHENHRNSNCFVFDDSQLLSDYHCHFHAYPMILSVCATGYCLNFENKRKYTHARTCTRAGDNLQYNISTELNILKCAHDFLKCMLCLTYPTIILELKSKKYFGRMATKNNFISARFFLIKPIKILSRVNFHYILLL